MTWTKRMVEKYGTTSDVRRAAFVLRDGTLVKSIGDHYKMASATAPATSLCRRVGGPGHCLEEFMKTASAVRTHWWTAQERDAEVFVGMRLTTEQRHRLREFVGGRGRIFVDVRDGRDGRFCETEEGSGRFRQLDACLRHEGVELEMGKGLDGAGGKR